jgi:pyridoxamine 5'-phosphate oxidase family protein
LLSEPEINYLKSQSLVRIATVSGDGQPDLVPVRLDFDGKYFWIGSNSQEQFFGTRKYKNVNEGDNKVALLVDDLLTVSPWHPRSIRVYGTADVVDHVGKNGPGKYLRITPKITWSNGIEGLDLKEGERWLRTVHDD